MHRKLWEREADALFVEYGVNLLVHIKIYVPVVATLYPDTDYYIHAAGIQGMKGDKRLGNIQDTAVFGDDTTHGAFHLIIIFTVFPRLPNLHDAYPHGCNWSPSHCSTRHWGYKSPYYRLWSKSYGRFGFHVPFRTRPDFQSSRLP